MNAHDIARAQRQEQLSVSCLCEQLIRSSRVHVLGLRSALELLECYPSLAKADRRNGLIGETHLLAHRLLIGEQDDQDVEIVRGPQVTCRREVPQRPHAGIEPDIGIIKCCRNVSVVQTLELGVAQSECDDIPTGRHLFLSMRSHRRHLLLRARELRLELIRL